MKFIMSTLFVVFLLFWVGLSAASSARENEAGVANHGTGARQTRDSTVRDCDASPVYLPPTATITSQRLADLRSQMTVNGYNAYIVPSEDEHLSEYIAPREKRRAWITGFSGSAGTAAITQNEAALWTDGRYFLQAEQQLDCNWQLMRIGQPGVPSIEEWINSKLSSNTVGANPFVFSIENWQSYETSFATANNDFNQSIPDLIDDIWQDRPPTLGTEIIILPVEYAGKDWKVKIADVRQRMTEVGADYLLLTVLEEIAWLFNLRGNDIPSVPVFTSYAIVSRDSSIRIYANETQLQPMELQDYLRPQGCLDDHICVDSRKIDEAREDLLGLSDTDTVWMSSASTTYGMYSAVPLERQIQQESPIRIPKSVKNEVEIQGMRQAHIYDAVALCEYLWWLEENVPSLGLNEITGAEKLKTLRLAQEKSKGLSFGSISASGPNGAVIHYGTSEETNRNLTTDEVYLIDSGGQYFEGTTDVTRSVHFGIPTAFEIEAYTRVLMGMIDVELAVFPSSVDGNVLDFVARKYLYDVGLDYRHGTGHGLGHYLSVHEYPPAIGRSYVTGYTLQIGMFTSNEPGYYDEGKFGIRLENVVMVNYTDTKYHFGEYQYYSMTPVTLVPFQKKMIDVSMLTGNQLTYLNAYHSRVLREVGSEAQKQQKYGLYDWLSKVTTPILRSGSHRTVFTSWSVIISFVLALLHARPNMVADV